MTPPNYKHGARGLANARMFSEQALSASVIRAVLGVERTGDAHRDKPKITLPRVAWLEKRLKFWDDPEPRRRRR